MFNSLWHVSGFKSKTAEGSVKANARLKFYKNNEESHITGADTSTDIILSHKSWKTNRKTVSRLEVFHKKGVFKNLENS